jgi:toxin-antitoxin system PIN domain toxin
VLLADVNVLVHAFRRDTERHREYHAWLEDVVNGEEAYGVSELVLSGFLPVATHPRIFDPPPPLAAALSFADSVRESPNAVSIQPDSRHWSIFECLCREASARGNLVSDATVPAIAIESGCEWITADRDYSRFTGLRWRHRPAPHRRG